MFDRISAVQQRIGASRFTVASPVLRPTLSGPNSRQSASHFSFTSALIGQVYTDRLLSVYSRKRPSKTSLPDRSPLGIRSSRVTMDSVSWVHLARQRRDIQRRFPGPKG